MVATRQQRRIVASTSTSRRRFVGLVAVVALVSALVAVDAGAIVLPEDRSDSMYHYYKGDDVEVSGPALLVRRSFAERISFSAGYYADTISSASVDVITNASPYEEKRNEFNLGLDYLYGNSLMSLAYTNSSESDYAAQTYDLGISTEMFSGMTTVSLGFAYGDDVVERVDTDFKEGIGRYNYRLNFSQVMSSTIVLDVGYEAITEDGFLNNPYRSARLLGASVPERYPGTRTSNAVALRAMKYWTPRASSRLEYRYFWDTWDITAHTLELGYSKYFGSRWLADLHYRFYTQDSASFYSDNFDREFNYMARDKELSTFNSHAVGLRLSYTLFDRPWGILNRGTLNLGYEFIHSSYDDFTDLRNGKSFSFNANVVQVYLSARY